MFTFCRFGLVLYLLVAVTEAPASVCEPPTRGLELAIERGGAATFEQRPEVDVAISRRHLSYFSAAEKKIGIGYRHDYTTIDTDKFPAEARQSRALLPILPASTVPSPERDLSSNGHLHRLAVSMDFDAIMPNAWTLRLQPALSLSSNLLKDPEKIDGEAWQLDAALLRDIVLSPESGFRLGVCADHRFGDYRWYPKVDWRWQRERWLLSLGFPDNRVQRRFTDSLSLSLQFHPRGNRWRVHDEARGDSFYRYQAWRLRAALVWSLSRAWQLSFSLARSYQSEHRFRLETGEDFPGESDEPWQVGLTLQWQR